MSEEQQEKEAEKQPATEAQLPLKDSPLETDSQGEESTIEDIQKQMGEIKPAKPGHFSLLKPPSPHSANYLYKRKKKDRLKICCDLDEVVFDFLGDFIPYMKEKLSEWGVKIPDSPKWTTWDGWKFYGATEEQFKTIFDMWCKDGRCTNLDLVGPIYKRVVSRGRLRKFTRETDVVFVTARPVITLDNTIAALKKQDLIYSKLYHIGDISCVWNPNTGTGKYFNDGSFYSKLDVYRKECPDFILDDREKYLEEAEVYKNEAIEKGGDCQVLAVAYPWNVGLLKRWLNEKKDFFYSIHDWGYIWDIIWRYDRGMEPKKPIDQIFRSMGLINKNDYKQTLRESSKKAAALQKKRRNIDFFKTGKGQLRKNPGKKKI